MTAFGYISGQSDKLDNNSPRAGIIKNKQPTPTFAGNESETGDIAYKAVVTPRVKRKVSIKAAEKPVVKQHQQPRKNEVTITPITPARNRKVQLVPEPKKFASTPDISNSSQKSFPLPVDAETGGQFGSPSSARRRMPLSTANQNIVSFFENKHKMNDFPAMRPSLKGNLSAAKTPLRQSEIPKAAAYLDFPSDEEGTMKANREFALNYVPTTSMVSKTKALFEKENLIC